MIFLLDKNMTVFKIIPRKDVLELWQAENINEVDTIEGALRLTKELWGYAESAYYYALQDINDKYSFHIYKNINTKTSNNQIAIYGIQLGYDEMRAMGYIKDYRPTGKAAKTVFQAIINDTGWEIGYFDDRLPDITTTFYYLSRLEALGEFVSIAGAELDFRAAITKNKVTAKYVDVYYQQGGDNGKRFVYGSNALTIVRESDEAELCTALIGRGKGEEVGETESGDATYGRRIGFSGVAWKKSAGRPVDKPAGQEWVEIPEATALYGYPNGKPRTGIIVYESIEDPEELLEKTYKDLVEMSRPKVQFKSTVSKTGSIAKGETVTIVRYDLGFCYQTRATTIKRNRLNDALTEVAIGDCITQPQSKALASRINSIKSGLSEVNYKVNNVALLAANGTKVVYGTAEPTTKKAGDLWYKTLDDEKVELYQWNGEYWELLANDITGQEAKEAGEAAKQLANQSVDDAAEALKRANKAVDDALAAHDTANALILSVGNIEDKIGIPYKVKEWEQGSINLTTGGDISSTAYLRSGYIDVAPGEKYISQLKDGTSVTMVYFYYDSSGFMSYRSTSAVVTIPDGCSRLRVRVAGSLSPETYTGNIFQSEKLKDYSGAATLYSALLLQKDWINLRVAKNDIINQINVSAEGILISGSKVHITGTTTIDSGVIKTAHIADAAITNAKIDTLSASKITTGTLNASNVNVINLSANNIVSGTISADRIAANSITADKLAANTIMVGFNNLGNTMNLTSTYLSFLSSSVETMRLNNSGTHFYRNSTYVGYIGTGEWANDPSKKGLGFRLDDGQYMIWAKKNSSGIYIAKLTWTTDNTATGFQGFKFDDKVDFGNHMMSGLALSSPYVSTGELGVGSSASLVVYNGGGLDFYRTLNMHGYSILNSSGHSIKTNFAALDSYKSLQYIIDTDVLEFEYKGNPGSKKVGFIINDDGESPYHTDGNLITDGQYRDDSILVGHLMLAVKALKNEIEQLKTK